jgi:hypothetical protein
MSSLAILVLLSFHYGQNVSPTGSYIGSLVPSGVIQYVMETLGSGALWKVLKSMG